MAHCDKCFDMGRTEGSIDERLLNPTGNVKGSFAEEARSELGPEGQVGVTQLAKLREIHTISKQTKIAMEQEKSLEKHRESISNIPRTRMSSLPRKATEGEHKMAVVRWDCTKQGDLEASDRNCKSKRSQQDMGGHVPLGVGDGESEVTAPSWMTR